MSDSPMPMIPQKGGNSCRLHMLDCIHTVVKNRFGSGSTRGIEVVIYPIHSASAKRCVCSSLKSPRQVQIFKSYFAFTSRTASRTLVKFDSVECVQKLPCRRFPASISSLLGGIEDFFQQVVGTSRFRQRDFDWQ